MKEFCAQSCIERNAPCIITVRLILLSSTFCEEVHSQLSYVTWFSHPQRELTNLLGLHPRIETVRASCAALKSRPSAPDFVQQGFERLLGRYQSVQQDLEDRQQQLENGKRAVSFITSLFALILKITPSIWTFSTFACFLGHALCFPLCMLLFQVRKHIQTISWIHNCLWKYKQLSPSLKSCGNRA